MTPLRTVPLTNTWNVVGVTPVPVVQVKFPVTTVPAAVPAGGAKNTGMFAALPGAMLIGNVGGGAP